MTEIRLPPTTGLRLLRVLGSYQAELRQQVLTVVGLPAPGNLGPGLYERRVIAAKSGALLGERMRALLLEIEGKVRAGELPKRDVHLDKCNVAKDDLSDFLASACAHCKCPYCELSE